MSKLRVAIIGTGMIANSAHFPALNILRKEGLVDVVGVADIRETAAAETAKRHDVPNWYTDPQKMLDELKPDFVAVCNLIDVHMRKTDYYRLYHFNFRLSHISFNFNLLYTLKTLKSSRYITKKYNNIMILGF